MTTERPISDGIHIDPGISRTERRRRLREAAKADKAQRARDQRITQLATPVLADLHTMRANADRYGWADVVLHIDAAIDAAHRHAGLEVTRHLAAAGHAIEAHQRDAR